MEQTVAHPKYDVKITGTNRFAALSEAAEDVVVEALTVGNVVIEGWKVNHDTIDKDVALGVVVNFLQKQVAAAKPEREEAANAKAGKELGRLK